jgi:intein/homing endonuclease
MPKDTTLSIGVVQIKDLKEGDEIYLPEANYPEGALFSGSTKTFKRVVALGLWDEQRLSIEEADTDVIALEFADGSFVTISDSAMLVKGKSLPN